MAVCSMEARLVNLTDNKILWRFSTEQQVPVEGKNGISLLNILISPKL